MCKMATSITILNVFFFMTLVLLHSFGEVAGAPFSHQLSKRNFEQWLEQSGINTSFDISKFGEEIPFHKNEMAHLYQGDIKGFGGRMVLATDGKKHLKISRWPNGIVPYVITGSYSKQQLSSLQRALKQFEIYTCVRFVKREQQKDYIKIQSTEDSCWSFVGKIRRQPQAVNLAADGCTSLSTILHELMHALGFIHEHSRPDRDNFVTIHWENIEDEEIKHNFEVDDETFEDVGVPYDTNSVMQYGDYFFAASDDKPTMTAKNGKPLGNSKGFSWSDIKEINNLYECKKKKSKENGEKWKKSFKKY